MGKYILIASLLLTTALSLAQEGASIMGKIEDGELNNEPLHFANISLKNTSKTAHTNFHGNFELKDIEVGSYTLLISYPGYRSKEVLLTIEDNKTYRLEELLFANTINVSAILMESESANSTMRSEISSPADK
ncbi:MAG: carboxypeptidase-like regulatory domain-containing protein [Flavobacteriaceae bacterium]